MLVALATAGTHLDLLGLNSVVVRGSETQLGLHLSNLLDGELGQVLGDLERPLLLNVGLGEDHINLLKVTSSSLDVEEVGEWNTDEVNQCEEKVDTPGALRREDGSKHDDSEVGDPVGTGGGGGTSGTGTEGVDLGRVDPGERQESEGEEDDEEEDTDNGTL